MTTIVAARGVVTLRVFSMLDGDMFLPAELMISSFLRSVIVR